MNKSLQNRINSNLPRAKGLTEEILATLKNRQAVDAQAKIDAGLTNKHGEQMGPAVEWAKMIAEVNKDFDGQARQFAACGKAFDLANFARILRGTNKGDKENYMQAKTAEKVFAFVSAIFTGASDRATEYCVQIMHNALRNGGEIHITDAQASLSRRIIPTDAGKVHTRGSNTTGTAVSQTSQIRMLAHALRFAEVNKGKRGDVMKIKPELMTELRELFAPGLLPSDAEIDAV